MSLLHSKGEVMVRSRNAKAAWNTRLGIMAWCLLPPFCKPTGSNFVSCRITGENATYVLKAVKLYN